MAAHREEGVSSLNVRGRLRTAQAWKGARVEEVSDAPVYFEVS